MFNTIRRKIGLYYFRRELAKLDFSRRMVNLRGAKRIGILYTLDEVPDYDKVSRFVKELQMEHKEVRALGFVKSRALTARFLPKLSYDFFSKKDITWFYKPIHQKVRDFIAGDFDLLIDLSLADSFPLKYISGLSHALCRVGRFSAENTPFYDFMIDLKPAMTADDFLGQIRHYLTIITTNEKQAK
jgi:hypothetical protein